MGRSVTEALKKDLLRVFPAEKVVFDKRLDSLTNFRIGGPADIWVEADSVEDIQKVCGWASQNGVPFFFLGNGSNLLVSDEGFRGVVVSAGEGRCELSCKDHYTIQAGCGVTLAKLARKAAAEEWTGLEFAAGIPGSVGGAVYMNAGAYGGEMKQVLTSIRYLDQGEIKEMSAEDAQLSYRHSIFMDNNAIILSARFGLAPGKSEEIESKMHELAIQRKSKQPLEYPSAGSMFKRPEGYFAGKLIQDAGLAGYQVGGAQVSSKHCGFVINVGGATCSDVRHLVRDVHRKVLEQFGVEIWPEVRYLSPDGLAELLPRDLVIEEGRSS